MVGVAKADFCGASAAPSKRAPRRQRETVRNILLFIVMDGAGGAGGAREEGCATGEPGTGDRVEKPPAWDPVPGIGDRQDCQRISGRRRRKSTGSLVSPRGAAHFGPHSPKTATHSREEKRKPAPQGYNRTRTTE